MKFWKLASAAIAIVLSTNTNAVIISSENFNSDASGWTNSVTSDFGGNTILGGYNVLGFTDQTSKDFAISNGQSQVTIEFDFYRIDSWDNEYFDVVVNSEIIVHDMYHQFGGDTNIDGGLYNDEIIHYSLLLDVNASNLLLTFDTNLNQGRTDESWGIDNLVITQTTVVPVPAAVWLFGSGLIGIVGFARRKQS